MKATLILSIGDLKNLVDSINHTVESADYGDLSDNARCVHINFPLGASNGDHTMIHAHEAEITPCAPLKPKKDPHRPDVKPGRGYRILNNGETVEAGDEIQNGRWRGPTWWELVDRHEDGRLIGKCVDCNWAAVRRAL